MSGNIAIVGMACCYADACDPRQLWENVLARRRAFRRIPPERLLLRDYYSPDLQTPDTIYATEAALIDGYAFDRVHFRVAGPTFRSVDMTHWLALDIAGRALKDAGFLNGGHHQLPLESTGVLVGNTLTGEFSRSAIMRLRWPYVRRVTDSRLRTEGWDEQHRQAFLRDLEQDYKAPFAPVGEETLAGALSNTIAGRICNHFHFEGGGYTLDGACSSSLLAVVRACTALESGEVDVALAGGVDLSLDPFELVGFAKAGALAHGEMLVYDRESSGFLPGEGCGFVVLMRENDASAMGLRSYSVVRGWGISSDGAGSITRPEISGQTLALRRAYQRAGYGAETVALFEGHGTGTPVGDEVELQALTAVRRSAGSAIPPAAIGSIKANIGHTKAAAGIAGLIKAAMAIHHQTLPPATGIRKPRPELQGEAAVLRVTEEAEAWPADLALRAGVNSFGFGGINVHVTLADEGERESRRSSPREQSISSISQDTELFLFAADSRSALTSKIELASASAAGLSYAELGDAAVALAGHLGAGPWRAAVVANSPGALYDKLKVLLDLLGRDIHHQINTGLGVFLGVSSTAPAIALLFPGQAAPVRLNGGVHERFSVVRDLYRQTIPEENHHPNSTYTAQIAIATAEVAGLRLLRELGLEASVAVGHSLGELAAYCWAGVIEEDFLLALVRTRAQLMSKLPAGSMASFSRSAREVESLLQEEDGPEEHAVIACFNGPRQIVAAGESPGIARMVDRARERGWSASLLPTAHAFHSPMMKPAADPFCEFVSGFPLKPLQRRVVSTITGAELSSHANLRPLLVEQLTAPVRFAEALAQAGENADLFLEVGPGRILTHLVAESSQTPAVALDIGGSSLSGLLHSAAAAHVLGASLRTGALFEDRFSRPFDFARKPEFFLNPCELAPPPVGHHEAPPLPPRHAEAPLLEKVSAATSKETPLRVVRSLIARHTELPPATITENSHLLRDLHLNSIAVGELVALAARELGMEPPQHLLEFADATVGETAKALEGLRGLSSVVSGGATDLFPGVSEWQRPFRLEWIAKPLRRRMDSPLPPGQWQLFGPLQAEFAEAVSRDALPGTGVIVCLAAHSLEETSEVLLKAAHAVLALPGQKRYFVVLGEACVAAAFARTLHLEDPAILTRVIEGPSDAAAVNRIFDEINAPGDSLETRYDAHGLRYQPCMRLLADSDDAEETFSPGPDDVILVSGGGKGIAAECSLDLARETGAALLILGRSRPEEDAPLALHLKKARDCGARARYLSVDVTDAQAVRAAVMQSEEAFGRVTGIIHGAGRNQPRLLRELDLAAMRATFAPKVQGLRNLLAAVDTSHLRMLVTFGSIIGRAGMRGEADYALANACQSLLTEEFAREHAACRCLAFESSAWSGIGMAERLGSVETLRREGITAIPLENGVAWFRRLLLRRLSSVSVMLTGRLGAHPPLPVAAPGLPLLRFIEKPRVYYPGVELVADAELSTASDPYLLDHVFQGQPLLPGVIALEAMTQAAMALSSASELPLLSDVRFERPIVVEAGAHVTLRVAALVSEQETIEVVVRSSSTSFLVDHVRCLCSFAKPRPASDREATQPPTLTRPAIAPQSDLYGKLLFQTGRFRRLTGYQQLSARSCWAEIETDSGATWFSQYLPPALLLGDPGARDAALHAVQACVPHAVLLPIGVGRLYMAPLNSPLEANLLVHAERRWVDGATYCYDIELRACDGSLRERWQDVRFRKIAESTDRQWPDPLVAAFLEWRLEETIPSVGVTAAFDRDPSDDRRARSARAIQKAYASPLTVSWRADGKPQVQNPGMGVSAAHSNGLTLAVAGFAPVACDLEPVRSRSEEVWRDLLGLDRWRLAKLIVSETGEDLQIAATRVWTALESLKKAEAARDTALVLLACSREQFACVSLAASGLKIATSVVLFRDYPTPFAVSLLARSAH